MIIIYLFILSSKNSQQEATIILEIVAAKHSDAKNLGLLVFLLMNGLGNNWRASKVNSLH